MIRKKLIRIRNTSGMYGTVQNTSVSNTNRFFEDTLRVIPDPDPASQVIPDSIPDSGPDLGQKLYQTFEPSQIRYKKNKEKFN